MSAGNAIDRNDFDIPASQSAQEQFKAVADHLESLIDQRDADVKRAMADYQADGVSEEYAAKEVRWNNVAGEVKDIIHVLLNSLGGNDETASHSLRRAGSAVAAI